MESKLVERVQRDNDHHAFEQLMRQNQSPIRQFLRRLTLQNQGIADELAQETFLKAFVHIKTYRGEAKFLSWLFKIAYQQFVSSTRKKTEQTNVEVEDKADDGQFERRLVAEKTVKNLLKYLKADERAIFLLHFSHDLTHQEIALVMQIPLGTVKTKIRRSRLKLKSFTEINNSEKTDEK
ncbi:MAG: RNA polymerase sigma factor [Colwellia sp.]|nr:RNA polymerase sigma factor [Colwellia sp.]